MPDLVPMYGRTWHGFPGIGEWLGQGPWSATGDQTICQHWKQNNNCRLALYMSEKLHIMDMMKIKCLEDINHCFLDWLLGKITYEKNIWLNPEKYPAPSSRC